MSCIELDRPPLGGDDLMPPSDEVEVTLGELSRHLGRMETRIEQQFASVNRRFDTLQFVPRELYDYQVGALIDRVKLLEDAKRRGSQLFVGAFLYPVLVAVIVALVLTGR